MNNQNAIKLFWKSFCFIECPDSWTSSCFHWTSDHQRSCLLWESWWVDGYQPRALPIVFCTKILNHESLIYLRWNTFARGTDSDVWHCQPRRVSAECRNNLEYVNFKKGDGICPKVLLTFEYWQRQLRRLRIWNMWKGLEFTWKAFKHLTFDNPEDSQHVNVRRG